MTDVKILLQFQRLSKTDLFEAFRKMAAYHSDGYLDDLFNEVSNKSVVIHPKRKKHEG